MKIELEVEVGAGVRAPGVDTAMSMRGKVI